MKRVGHKGADAIVPGNTLSSFDAAVAAGVDMIEFDVLARDPRRPGTSPLILAHDYEHDISAAPTLEEALDHLAVLDVALDVDLKWHGYEDRVAAALRERDLVERSLVSSQFMRSLTQIGRAEPALRRGWSIPRARRDYTASRLYAVPALAVLARMRRRAPGRARHHLTAGRIQAVMAHWRLVSPALVGAVHEAGGELYVWTVDDAARIAALEALGADGVITNDPRLFAAAAAAPA